MNCWTQSGITLTVEEAQKTYEKLVMGAYYEDMYHLNSKHISVLEEKVSNVLQENQTQADLIVSLQSENNILVEKNELWEDRFKTEEKFWKRKNMKVLVVGGVVCLSLGVLIGVGALM